MTAEELSNHPSVAALIEMAMAEDIGDGDITSGAIFTAQHRSQARIIAKERGVLCGCFMAEAVYKRIDPSLEILFLRRDGDRIEAGISSWNLRAHGLDPGRRKNLPEFHAEAFGNSHQDRSDG
jgi:nicotinate-nucleotide pyrophosphorylase (carboxylating)